MQRNTVIAVSKVEECNAKAENLLEEAKALQKENWFEECAQTENLDPFQVFISGPGGVGNLALIKAIY